jgi:hypothetical protein
MVAHWVVIRSGIVSHGGLISAGIANGGGISSARIVQANGIAIAANAADAGPCDGDATFGAPNRNTRNVCFG